MTDQSAVIEMLRVSAQAIRNAIETHEINHGLYRDMAETTAAVANAFDSEADALERTVDDVPVEPALVGQIDNDGPDSDWDPNWDAERFNAANFFSEPEGDDWSDWHNATIDALTRMHGPVDLETAEVIALAFSGYERRVRTAVRNLIATQVQSQGVRVEPKHLAMLVTFRDIIAAQIRTEGL